MIKINNHPSQATMPTESPKILIALDLDDTLITSTGDKYDYDQCKNRYHYNLNNELLDYLIKFKKIYKDDLIIVLTTCNRDEKLINDVIEEVNQQFELKRTEPEPESGSLINESHSLETTNKRPIVNQLIAEYKPREVWLIDDKIFRGYFSLHEYTIKENEYGKEEWTTQPSTINVDESTLSCITDPMTSLLLYFVLEEKFKPGAFRYKSAEETDYKSLSLKLRFIQAPFLHMQPSCCKKCCFFNRPESTEQTWDEYTIQKYFPPITGKQNPNTNESYNPPPRSTGNAKNTGRYGTIPAQQTPQFAR
jgi:hypothetical protein